MYLRDIQISFDRVQNGEVETNSGNCSHYGRSYAFPQSANSFFSYHIRHYSDDGEATRLGCCFKELSLRYFISNYSEIGRTAVALLLNDALRRAHFLNDHPSYHLEGIRLKRRA